MNAAQIPMATIANHSSPAGTGWPGAGVRGDLVAPTAPMTTGQHRLFAAMRNSRLSSLAFIEPAPA
jgi:hypothetical protein